MKTARTGLGSSYVVPSLIVAYLSTDVAANLAVTHFGPEALPYTALALIPFDLVSRDFLHEHWHGLTRPKFWLRMGGLVLAGALISAILNINAARIALASLVAFASAGLIDTVVYGALHHRSKYFRINASNIASALADSVLFQLVAFGSVSLPIFAKQSALKIIGGTVFGILFVGIAARLRRTSSTSRLHP